MASDFDHNVFKAIWTSIDLIVTPQVATPPSLQHGHCIPQREYKGGAYCCSLFEQDRVLFFLQDGFLPVNAALRRNRPELICGDELALPRVSTHVTLRFEWPGYPSRSYQLKTVDQRKSPQRLTVSKLSVKVGRLVRRFIEEMECVPIAPEYAEWRVGPKGIGIKDLYLASLDRVSGGSWQPRLFYRPSL